MALAHTAAVRNQMADDMLTQIGINAQLQLYKAGDLEVAILTLPNPSGTVTLADLDFGVFVDDTSAAGGTVTYLAIETTAGAAEIFRFNPTGDGVTLSNTVIGVGDTVSCSALAWTAPA